MEAIPPPLFYPFSAIKGSAWLKWLKIDWNKQNNESCMNLLAKVPSLHFCNSQWAIFVWLQGVSKTHICIIRVIQTSQIIWLTSLSNFPYQKTLRHQVLRQFKLYKMWYISLFVIFAINPDFCHALFCRFVLSIIRLS